MSINFQDLWKGHLLIFEKPCLANHDRATGQRFLIAFVLVAFLAIPILQQIFLVADLNTHIWSRLALVGLILSVFVITKNSYLEVAPKNMGLHPWKQWTPREQIYLLQTVPVIGLLFAIIFEQHLVQLIAQYGLVNFIFFSLLTGLLWGMAQEFIYRGLLQTELVARFGSIAGILIANLVFTFGPLHANYFHFGSDLAVQWTMFMTIYAIGLLFSVIYHRSGNLWIAAIFHGLWPLNMT